MGKRSAGLINNVTRTLPEGWQSSVCHAFADRPWAQSRVDYGADTDTDANMILADKVEARVIGVDAICAVGQRPEPIGAVASSRHAPDDAVRV